MASAGEPHDVTRHEAWEIWESLSDAERRDHILETFPAKDWYDEDAFPSLIAFRHNPIQWARIKATFKSIGGNTWDLEKAADATIGAPVNLSHPAALKNGRLKANEPPGPSLDVLLMRFPELHDDLVRDIGTSDTDHAASDAIIMELGIREGWKDGAIYALILDIHEAARHMYPDATSLPSLLGSAYLRAQGVEEITGTEEGAAQKRLAQIGKAKLIAYLSKTWKLEIDKIVRHGIEQSLWNIVLRDGREIHLGGTKELCSQGKTRIAIFDATGINIPRIPAKNVDEWDALLKVVFDAAETIVTPEMTREGQMRAMITGYLEEQECFLDHDIGYEEWERIAWERRPFVRQGRVHLHAQHMWESYVHRFYKDLTQPQLIDMFAILGATRRTIAIHGERTTSRSFWVIDIDSVREYESEMLSYDEDV